MGEYLRVCNSQEKFHYAYMDEMRKKVKYWRKDYLLQRLVDDFKIELPKDTLVEDLVQVYMTHWVREVEKTY